MIASTPCTRVTRFSLPAEHSSAVVLRRFIREIASFTHLTASELQDLQMAATKAFDDAVCQQSNPGEGRVALKIDASPDEICVDVSYRAIHFPPAEIFSRS